MQAVEKIIQQQQCIRLYTRKEKDSIDIGQQTSITVDLSKWRLLAQGGAYWVFYYHKQQQQKQLNSKHKPSKYQQQTGQSFIFRTRQLKQLKQLAKIRSKMIFCSFFKENITNDLLLLKSQLENQQIRITQLLATKIENDPLSEIIHCVYERFLQRCQVSPQPLIPKISQHIVPQSQPYYLYDFNLSSTNIIKQAQTQNIITNSQSFIKNSQLFINFLLKQLIYKELSTKLEYDDIKKDILDQIMQEHFQQYPIDFIPFINNNKLRQQLSITFQHNLLDIHHCKDFIQELKKQPIIITNPNHTPSQQSDSFSYRFTIGQVFQFKPKSILPDIYTEMFLDEFADIYQYDESINRLDKVVSQRNQQKTMLKKEIADNLLRTNRQHGLIKEEIIKRIQETIEVKNNEQFNLCSTRWFKKNCLLVEKKKNNENPLVYFRSCLERMNNNKINNNNISNKTINCNQQINYYNKKHLRKLQLLNVIKNQSQKHSIITYQQQQQFHNQQLNNKIIAYITQKVGKEGKLSLVEEILALQIIDVIGMRQEQYQYMDALRLKFFVRELKSLRKNKSLQEHFNNDEKYQMLNNHIYPIKQKNYPTKAFELINKAFHPQVYEKAQQLCQLLKQIIFQSEQVDQQIAQAFFINPSQQKSTQVQTQSKVDLAKMQIIKQLIFYLARFLISLTWKDISILIQQTLNITVYQSNQKSTNQSLIKWKNYFNNSKNLNQIKVHQSLMKQLLVESVQWNNTIIDRKIIGCGIIDYGIKTLQNINKNVQKDHLFLKNYLHYKISSQR